MKNNRTLQMFNYDRMTSNITGYFRAHKYWAGLDAYSFAEAKHGDTMRKSGGLKYFCHPILVAYLGVLLNLEPEIVTAALLHDVTEDAHADFSALPGGQVVQDAVKAVSIMKIRPDESKSDTKIRYYGRMDENIYGLIVKMLDRMSNLTSMVGVLSEESIVRNICETDQKLLPAVKRARKTKELEYRKKRDVLFVLQQALRSINEPLAVLYNIDEVQRKKHDIARTHARLEGRLEARDADGNFLYPQADMALMVANETSGKYANGDSKALRMMLLAAFVVAYGITEDEAIATILLGDLPDVDMSGFNPQVQRAVRRLRMFPLVDENPEKTSERYYAELSQCREALLAKALYRWYEISYGLDDDVELARLIIETDKYLVPALEVGRDNFGEFSSILEFMTFILRLNYDSIAKFKGIELEPIRGFYEQSYVE